jgi:hypothetical protein
MKLEVKTEAQIHAQYALCIPDLSIPLFFQHSQPSSGTITTSYPFQKTESFTRQVDFQ